jgi:hypothetical protein
MHWDGVHLVGDFSKPPVGEELCAHAGDPESDFDAFETLNLADNATFAPAKATMRALAVAHWQKNASSSTADTPPSAAEPTDPTLRRLIFELWNGEE